MEVSYTVPLQGTVFQAVDTGGTVAGHGTGGYANGHSQGLPVSSCLTSCFLISWLLLLLPAPSLSSSFSSHSPLAL